MIQRNFLCRSKSNYHFGLLMTKETDERQKDILLSRDQRQNNDIGVDFVMFCITITANPAGSNVDPLVEVNGQV